MRGGCDGALKLRKRGGTAEPERGRGHLAPQLDAHVAGYGSQDTPGVVPETNGLASIPERDARGGSGECPCKHSAPSTEWADGAAQQHGTCLCAAVS